MVSAFKRLFILVMLSSLSGVLNSCIILHDHHHPHPRTRVIIIKKNRHPHGGPPGQKKKRHGHPGKVHYMQDEKVIKSVGSGL